MTGNSKEQDLYLYDNNNKWEEYDHSFDINNIQFDQVNDDDNITPEDLNSQLIQKEDQKSVQIQQELDEAANSILDVLRGPLSTSTSNSNSPEDLSIDNSSIDEETIRSQNISIDTIYEMLSKTLAPLIKRTSIRRIDISRSQTFIPPHFESRKLIENARPILIDSLDRRMMPCTTTTTRISTLAAFYNEGAISPHRTLRKHTCDLPDGENLDHAFDEFRKNYQTPRYPLVFCHGLFGFDMIGFEKAPFTGRPLELVSYWRGIKEVLERNGVQVILTRVPASASIKERAEKLHSIISKKLPGQEINLIGHSMGGLDCRYLITHIKPIEYKIKSLTTIATPHRGSSFADYILHDIIGKTHLPPIYNALETLGIPTGAFDNLTVEYMSTKFNPTTPDDPNVRYYSYGSAFEPTLLSVFRFAWRILKDNEGPNDGLVSAHSAVWGKYLGTLNVSHLELINWYNRMQYLLNQWGITESSSKFNGLAFYSHHADFLASEGF